MKKLRMLLDVGGRGAPWRGLLLLNAALLAVLAAVTLGGPEAEAQIAGRGDYVMVAGNAKGANAGVVYIVDTIHQELIAITYDANTKAVGGIGYRNLAFDAAGPRPGN